MAGPSQSSAVSSAGASLEVMGDDVQTWSQHLPFKHKPVTRKASSVPISEACVSLLRNRASPCPLRDMVGLEVQERGQRSPMGSGKVTDVTSHFARQHQKKHPPGKDEVTPSCSQSPGSGYLHQ